MYILYLSGILFVSKISKGGKINKGIYKKLIEIKLLLEI